MEFESQLRAVAFDGRWSAEAVLHAMPLVLWTYFTAENVEMLCRTMAPVRSMIEEFAAKLDPSEELGRAIDRYYSEHPIEPSLWKALEAAFRTLRMESAPAIPAPRYLLAPKKDEGVPAGPLARFVLSLPHEK